ncbi:MAG TPA: hypothetical protein PKZ83_17675 [bacterium]|nr:hypothetical protein [bacterium]
MGKRVISIARVQTIIRLREDGQSAKDIALEVVLSPKYVGRMLRNGVFVSQTGVTTLFRTERQPHPNQHPCMLEKKLWPRCSHGEHCYLSCRCEAWANFNF